jgi:hypothetical protein
MTYCIAWKTKDAVFMTADSAITTTGSAVNRFNDRSSLGELSVKRGDMTIQEEANKILNVGKTLLLCYSGDVNLFLEVFNILKKYYDESKPEYSLQIAIDSVRTNASINLRLLFAYSVNNQVGLYSFNLNGDLKITTHDAKELISIGIFAQSESDRKNKERFQYLIDSGMNPFTIHLHIHFFVQSQSVFSDTLKYGVGGLYNSAFITPNYISYIDDTSIILYDAVAEKNTIIPRGICNFFNRYEAFICNSTISNSKEIFISFKENILFNDKELQAEIEDYSQNYRPSIVVFFSLNSKIGSIFLVEKKDEYFELNFNEGKIGLKTYQKCMDLLLVKNHTNEVQFNIIIKP